MIRKEVNEENGGKKCFCLSQMYKCILLQVVHVLQVDGVCFCDLFVVSTEAPVYLSSQSYMADSSLSEEMSQFDFSTGVQSFSFSSQNAEGEKRAVAKKVSFFSLLKSEHRSLK